MRTNLARLGIAVSLLLAGCDELDPDVTVEYRIEGNANQVLVTYRTNSLTDSQRSATLPFGYEADFPQGAIVGIVAQSLDGQPRDISCVLRVEGEVRDQDSASGTGVSVACEGASER